MTTHKKYHLTNIPFADTPSDTLYIERESGHTHLSFQAELLLCHAIKNGDDKLLDSLLKETFATEVTTGYLSKNPLMQTKYWCITIIANAIHYAILGGLDETDAYNLSDTYIQAIDSFTESDTCIDYLCQKAKELVTIVSRNQETTPVSSVIKKVLHYIHIHLHEKITIDVLANEVHLSSDYLSVLFLKETGSTIHTYILQQKLTEAQKMLLSGKSIQEVSYTLSFSSQSHFTSCFKKTYGMTPATFQKKMNL